MCKKKRKDKLRWRMVSLLKKDEEVSGKTVGWF